MHPGAPGGPDAPTIIKKLGTTGSTAVVPNFYYATDRRGLPLPGAAVFSRFYSAAAPMMPASLPRAAAAITGMAP